MMVTIDKCDNKSTANCYDEATIYRLKKSGITGSNEYTLMYDANEPSINLRLGSYGFMKIFPGTLERI